MIKIDISTEYVAGRDLTEEEQQALLALTDAIIDALPNVAHIWIQDSRCAPVYMPEDGLYLAVRCHREEHQQVYGVGSILTRRQVEAVLRGDQLHLIVLLKKQIEALDAAEEEQTDPPPLTTEHQWGGLFNKPATGGNPFCNNITSWVADDLVESRTVSR